MKQFKTKTFVPFCQPYLTRYCTQIMRFQLDTIKMSLINGKLLTCDLIPQKHDLHDITISGENSLTKIALKIFYSTTLIPHLSEKNNY